MKDLVKDYLSRNKTSSFSELLFKFIDDSCLTDAEVYKKVDIDRRTFSKIRNTTYIPKKNTILRLCIALKLTLREAEALLGSAGYTLSSSSEVDLIVKYCLENKIYDFLVVNSLVYSLSNTVL